MALRRCSACLFSTSTRSYLAVPPLPAYLASSSISNNSGSSEASTSSSASSTSSSGSGGSPSPSSRDESGKPPPLPRPLGMSEPPRKHVKPTLKQRRDRLLDKDARMQERKHLIKEATTGYFEDYNKIRHSGGKSWIAPKTLIQEKAALYFPEIEGTSLAKDRRDTPIHTSELLKGKISLVAMLNTRMSESHVESYTLPVLDAVKGHPDFQFVQINCQENMLKWIIVGIFISSLRRSVPEEFKENYLVSTQNLEYIREPLAMTNKHLGYCYLVDENCKVRWAAVSFAQRASGLENGHASGSKEVDEVSALSSCISVLLQRLAASREGKALQ